MRNPFYIANDEIHKPRQEFRSLRDRHKSAGINLGLTFTRLSKQFIPANSTQFTIFTLGKLGSLIETHARTHRRKKGPPRAVTH